MDEPKPTRRMTDMGPRRMDGFGRTTRPSVSPKPQAQPQQRPTRPQAPAQPVRPTSRSLEPRPGRPVVAQPSQAPRPQNQSGHETVQHDMSPAQSSGKVSVAQGAKWKVILQFVVGLAIIVIVAWAIVYLYSKYYVQ